MTYQKPIAEIIEIELENEDIVCTSYHDMNKPGGDISDLDGTEWP